MSEGVKTQSVKTGIKAFIHHVESLEKSEENDSFVKEYVQIQEVQMRNQINNVGSMNVGHMEENLKKNRYKDIVPYDDHRVVLNTLEGDEFSDYINASNIMGVTGTRDYIASQGPLSTTLNDFWRMIWENNIEIVFMISRLIEKKKIKCSQYWSNVGTSQEFGDITVFNEKEEDIVTECVQRNLRVTKGNDVHHVVQFQYCGWPDHGIPENLGDIRDIIATIREMRNSSKVPVLIHCSAGCGRTGAVIAIDYAWSLLEEGKFDENFSLFDLICSLREQRVSLVQTPDQYALVNKVLKSLCEERLIKLASHVYENVQLAQELSTVENGKEEQENDYEDIWTLPVSSEVNAPVLNPKEGSVTDERCLGRLEEPQKKVPTAEQAPEDESTLYANVAEIQAKLQEGVASNHEQPTAERTVHKTSIHVDSVSVSMKEKPLAKEVKELSADLHTPTSGTLDLKERNSPVHPNEANPTGDKKGEDLKRRGATRKSQKTASATAAKHSPVPKAHNATVISAVKEEFDNKMPHSDTSHARLRPSIAAVPLASVQKQQPVTMTAASGFNKRWSSTKSPGAAAHVPALSLYQVRTTSSTKSHGIVPATSTSLQRTSSLKFHGAAPTPSPSQKAKSISHTDSLNFPRKTTSIKLNANNKSSDIARLRDNADAVHSDNGAMGRSFSVWSHGNRNLTLERRVASHTPAHSEPTDASRFHGFVRINSRKQLKPDDGGREPRHQQQ